MSGVVSVGAAIGATALAAGSVASVGLTVGSAFAIMGAVGATLGAVGYFTKVKELQYAGAAIGAVGMIGGLASAAGMFGSAGSLFGSGMQTAGSFAGAASAQGASAAAETAGLWANVTPVALSSAPTAGYGALAGSFETGGVAGQVDAISMVNGTPQVATGEVATALAPNVTPESVGTGLIDSAPDSQGVPAFESPTEGFDISAPRVDAPTVPEVQTQVTGDVPDPAKGLIDSAPGMSPADQPALLDANGRIVPQGDVPAGPTEWSNPAAPTSAPSEPAGATVTGTASPQPSGIAGAGNTSPSVPGALQQQAPVGDVSGSASAASSAATPAQWGGTAPGKLDAPTSTWDGIFNWVQKNQTLSYGAIQTFGSFISGALKKDGSPELAAELAARREQNEAAKRLYDTQQQMLQRRMDNMNQAPVASRTPGGLINSGAAVTGRV